MHSDHLQYARQALAAYIEAAIQRFALSGQESYMYNMSTAEIKNAAGLTRLKSSVIDDYVTFFAMNGVTASYNESFEVLNISLNLHHCVMNAQQSEALAVAMAVFRSEHM